MDTFETICQLESLDAKYPLSILSKEGEEGLLSYLRLYEVDPQSAPTGNVKSLPGDKVYLQGEYRVIYNRRPRRVALQRLAFDPYEYLPF